MRTCPKCKSVIANDNAVFCKKCGSKLVPISDSNRHNYDGVLLGSQITPADGLRNKTESPSSGMTMLKAIKICFSKYAKFDGKASRSEYWYFGLFSFCLNTIPFILAIIIDIEAISLFLVAISFIYAMASLIPMISVTVRRLHDVGKSGSYIFLCFVPFVGSIILLYFLCKK